jgi:hypothetical protein
MIYAFVVPRALTLTFVSVLLSAGNLTVVVLALVTLPYLSTVKYGILNVPP